MSTIILGALTLVLLFIVILQISKASDLISALKASKSQPDDHRKSALFLSVLGFAILIYSVLTPFLSYKKFLPVPASEQGHWIQLCINITLFFTGIVFVVTQLLLFYFVYKYHYRKNRKAYFFADDNRLEIAWTVVPAIVLTILVGLGIQKWFKIFSPVPKEAITIEATGKQFAWVIRYPGADRQLGTRDFTLVTGDNELGVNWNQKASQDDFLADEIVLPVNVPVSVSIGALDVIHNFYLPEFRLMLDAVPGIPTHFWFRPTITTEEMRKIKNDPEFNYVLACNKLCGSGHYNMQKKVRIVTQVQYDAWLSTQTSYYDKVIKPGMAAAEAPAAATAMVSDSSAAPKVN